MNYSEYASYYKNYLLEDIIPFWMKNSPDYDQGGFFTCLDRKGNVYDSDKFVWLQGRQVWMYSMLYNQVSPKQEWLDVALHGATFLQKFGRADDGTWYFSLTQDGNPLVQPYNIFSDCFAAQAFGQIFKTTGLEAHAKIATDTFKSILNRQNNTKRHWSKAVSGTRPSKNFALPMILSNLALELEHLLDSDIVNELTNACVHEVMDVFYDSESGQILENVTPDGRFLDTFEGRLLNPGHAIEAMWFIIDIAAKKNDKNLIEKAKNITLSTIEYAWDTEYGGLYYFLDIKNHPTQQLEWDQKLWWVHIETLIALLKSYLYTRDEKCWLWFEKIHAYTWEKFPDPTYGEWFGYLNRQGQPLLSLKGGKWKGCYHVPRGLYQCWKTLEKL